MTKKLLFMTKKLLFMTKKLLFMTKNVDTLDFSGREGKI